MAQFRPPSKTVQLIDPRMQINKERVQAIQIGPKNNTWRTVSADSSLNANTVNFNYNATSVNDIIDRRFIARYYLQVVLTGVGNPLTSYGSQDALRFLPINSSCTSLELTINNSNQTVIPYQWLDGISRYLKIEDLRKDLSSSPSTPDLLYDYSLGAGPKNVLGGYSDNSLHSPDLRGSIVVNSISEGNGTSTIQFQIEEPFFVPPLVYQDRDQDGFIGVESLSLQLSHSWVLPNVWSTVGNTTINAVAVTMYNTPELLLNVMTPNELAEPYDRMATYVYNNVSMRHYPTDVGTINAGVTSQVNSGNIQLNCIPSRIYIFARKRKIDRVVTDPDVFASISNISVQFGNKSGLLASAVPRDLYKISVRNGYQYSYPAWSDYQGSVLCLKPSADLSLDLGEAPGLVIQKQLQISIGLRNQTANNQQYELIVVPVLPGAFYIQNGISSQSVGLLDPQQILDAPPSALVSQLEFNSEYNNMDVYGSGIFDILKKAFKFIAPKVASAVAGPLGDLALEGVTYLGKKVADRIKAKQSKYKKKGKGLLADDFEIFEEE